MYFQVSYKLFHNFITSYLFNIIQTVSQFHTRYFVTALQTISTITLRLINSFTIMQIVLTSILQRVRLTLLDFWET